MTTAVAASPLAISSSPGRSSARVETDQESHRVDALPDTGCPSRPVSVRCLQDRNQSIPLIRAHRKRVRSIPMIHLAPVLLSVLERHQQTRTFDHRYLSSQTSSMRQLLMMLLTIIVQPFTGGSQQ